MRTAKRRQWSGLMTGITRVWLMTISSAHNLECIHVLLRVCCYAHVTNWLASQPDHFATVIPKMMCAYKTRFPAKRNARNATDCVRKVRNKRKKITQSKTLRKTRFPSKRNARNRQPIGMVYLNSQSSKQPIKCLRCLRFSFTQRTQRNRLRCVRCV